MSMNKANQENSPKKWGWGLVQTVFAAALIGLALYQWRELLEVEAGGSTFCAINERLNCASVWQAPAAKAISLWSGIPVAGWGLVYGMMALALAVMRLWGGQANRVEQAAAFASRGLAIVGLLSSLALFGVTLHLGVFCLTCIGTYLLVIGYALGAFLTPARGSLKASGPVFVLLQLGVLWLLSFALVRALAPGAKAEALTQAPPKENRALDELISTLPSQAKAQFKSVLREMKAFQAPMATLPSPRVKTGSGPVHLVSFSDVRCGHCAHLEQTLLDLKARLPKGSFSVESRFFPLDAECNASLPAKATDGTGIRCLGAKALICMEGQPGYSAFQAAIFRSQARLNSARVFELAEQNGLGNAELEACLNAPQTQEALQSDIDYANAYRIQGTPLVLMNGRPMPPIPDLMEALILAKGEPGAPAFETL